MGSRRTRCRAAESLCTLPHPSRPHLAHSRSHIAHPVHFQVRCRPQAYNEGVGNLGLQVGVQCTCSGSSWCALQGCHHVLPSRLCSLSTGLAGFPSTLARDGTGLPERADAHRIPQLSMNLQCSSPRSCRHRLWSAAVSPPSSLKQGRTEADPPAMLDQSGTRPRLAAASRHARERERARENVIPEKGTDSGVLVMRAVHPHVCVTLSKPCCLFHQLCARLRLDGPKVQGCDRFLGLRTRLREGLALREPVRHFAYRP